MSKIYNSLELTNNLLAMAVEAATAAHKCVELILVEIEQQGDHHLDCVRDKSKRQRKAIRELECSIKKHKRRIKELIEKSNDD